MITPIPLPPSSAGIGRRLKNARASEIIPANARYANRPQLLYNISPIFTAPTGPANILIASLAFSALKENSPFPTIPNAVQVSENSALISWRAAFIAPSSQNFILCISTVAFGMKVIPNLHSSSQVNPYSNFSQLLSIAIVVY